MVEKRVQNINRTLSLFIGELSKEIRVDRVILFGSYSRGNPKDFSDIDIAVVSPDFEGGTEKDYRILDRAARKINVLIEALPYRPEDFKNFEKGDFIDEIINTGKIIYDKAA